MSILINKNTKVIVQGITGNQGKFHTEKMITYGTKIVAGVTPGKGGETVLDIPVFNTIEEAKLKKGGDASIIFVPAAFAADAIEEAAELDIGVIVCITDGIPLSDMIEVKHYLKERGTKLIGPNCPGVVTPGECKMGIIPGEIHKKGRVGVVSRSGSLTYEVVEQLSRLGIGQSTCIGIGGDPIPGSTFVDILRLFKEDEETIAVVMIGEIGGTQEEEAAEYIRAEFKKPAIVYIAGQTAPPEKRMGHAGAIITGGRGTARGKMDALRSAGAEVVSNPAHIGQAVKEVLGNIYAE